jgi:hypothetical protein
MHPTTDLSNIWICYECQRCFIFEGDKDDHTRTIGHKEFQQYDITETLDRGYGETTNIMQGKSHHKQNEESGGWQNGDSDIIGWT